jgi:hypothetical protein
MLNKYWPKACLAIVSCVALAGCLPQETGVNPDQAAPNPGQSNSAPVISGTPATQATVGSTYLFQPSALDSDGDTLSFSATGLPSWATINTQTGLVSGTPGSAHVGATGNIVVTVSDGDRTASLPGFQINVGTVSPPPPQNQPPTLSGSPTTSLAAGATFNFTPVAADPEGGTLAFSISLNGVPGTKPSWATFSTTTGQLNGIAQTGSYGIVITATDPAGNTANLSFTLTVSASAPTGVASLSWNQPTQNTDGTPLTDLAGYRVYHGLSANALNDVVELTGGNSTSHSFNALSSGTHYFAVSAFNSAGVESALSGVGSKLVP